MVTSTGRIDSRELVLLELTDDDGIVGIGEAAPLAGYSSSTIQECLAALRGGTPGPAEARACEDLAATDLAARRNRRSAFKTLAGREVAVNVTISSDAPAEVAAVARDGLERGFDCFKVKVGFVDDEDRIASVRKVIGDGSCLRIDANGVWRVEEAVAKIDALAEFGLELVEQPCATLAELAAVRCRVEVPIAADESVAGADEVREAARAEACDVVCVKLAAAGGPHAAREAIATARELGMDAYVASTLDGPWGIAAGIAVAAECGLTMACGLATLERFAGPLASALPRADGGLMTVPGGLGLGIDPTLVADLGDAVEELE